MKLVKRISLFMALSVVMLGLGGWGALWAEDFFYPNRYRHEAAKEPSVSALPSQTLFETDTLYLVEQVDLSEGTVTEREESVPVMYIGLNREELLEALSFYGENPPLTELENGFENIELTAFSRDRVAVCKYYRQNEPEGFYLMVADHFIVVCEEDRDTLYMNTDILLERLPDSLQREIMDGKYVASEEELYLFLESYSS